MKRNGFYFALLLGLTTWTLGCAPGGSAGEIIGGETEQICEGENCTEAGLNAPVAEEPQTPNYNDEYSDAPIVQGHYNHVDPNNLVPDNILWQALNYYDANYSQIRNKRWVSIFDATKHSSSARLYLIDMVTGVVKRYHVAHGKGSDTNADGYATQFSNTAESKMTSKGFYLTAETYYGSHGYSMRLDGLQSTNSNARRRAIVVHPASYVSESGNYSGRSWGCPAMDPAYSRAFIDKVKNGSLYYVYYKQ